MSWPLPHEGGRGFPSTPGWAWRKRWEAVLQRSAGSQRGRTRGEDKKSFAARGCSGLGSPSGCSTQGCPAGGGEQQPQLAGCGRGPSSSRRRAGSARPRHHSSRQEQDPAPLTPLSSLPQVPGRWRASWRGFTSAPPWPRRSSSPSTTRISRGHIATDETLEALGLLPAAAQISTSLDSGAGSPAPSSPRTWGGLFPSAPHRRGVSGAPRVRPGSPSSQLCCLWLRK